MIAGPGKGKPIMKQEIVFEYRDRDGGIDQDDKMKRDSSRLWYIFQMKLMKICNTLRKGRQIKLIRKLLDF